jgi:hypothetical protein
MTDESLTAPWGFVYHPASGPRRKVAFESRSDGTVERVESVWTGCSWRVTGREVVHGIQQL